MFSAPSLLGFGLSLALAILPISVAGEAPADVLAPGEQRFYEPDEGVDIGDSFGSALAMDGDWAVAGAKRDDRLNQRDAGAIYILKRSGGEWTIQQKLRPPAVDDSAAEFGAAVAMHGDVMAVGAPGAGDTWTPEKGKVYIYRRQGEMWNLEAELEAPQPLNQDRFGSSLAMGDGLLLVGAPRLPGLGRALFYEKTGAGWMFKQQLTASTPFDRTRFGASVALADGVALVGCPGSTYYLSNTVGRVFEFRLSETTWLETRIMTHPLSTARDDFGVAVALVDGRALIGAPNGRIAGNDWARGTAHLYAIADSGWTLLRSFAASGAAGAYLFGQRVALSATKALIAAPSPSYYSSDSARVMQLEITAADPAAWRFNPLVATVPPQTVFGEALALDGDNALIGAPADVNGGGAVFGSIVATIPAGPVGSTQLVTPPATRQQAGSGFGESMAITGSFAVVGASRYDSEWCRNAGCVYIFEREEGRWRVVTVLEAPDDTEGGTFGYAVAADGDRIAIAAPGVTDGYGSATAGKVFVYQRSGGLWPQQPAWVITPNSPEHYNFGFDLALSGTRLAIAVRTETRPASWITLYTLAPHGYSRGSSVRRHGESVISGFGNALAMDGHDLVVNEPPILTSDGFTGGKVSIYSNGAGPWTRRAQWLPPIGAADAFGALLALDAGVVAHSVTQTASVGYYYLQETWLQTYHRQGTSWKPLAPVPQPRRNGEREQCASVAVNEGAMLAGVDRDAYLYVRQLNGWRTVRAMGPPNRQAPIGFGSKVALSQRTAVIASSGDGGCVFPSVSFLPTSDVALSDGPTAPELQVAAGGTVPLGQFVVGAKIEVPLNVANRSLRPIRLTGATVEWTSAHASFQQVAVRDTLLQPGQSVPIGLAILPPADGEYAATLRLNHDDPDLGDLLFHITHTAVTAPVGLDVSPQTAVLTPLGEGLLLKLEITGTRTYSCQWFKDGRLLAGQTSRALFIPRAEATDAGLYQLQLSAPDDRVTQAEIPVGIYEEQRGSLEAKPDQALKLTARAWGPGVQIVWGVQYDSAMVRGVSTPTLHVARADALPEWLTANVLLGDSAQSCVALQIRLLSPPIISLDGLPSVLVKGQDFGASISDFSTSGLIATYTMSGLPPGLAYDPASGYIGGVPSRPGAYAVWITARNGHGASTPVAWLVRVVAVFEGDFGPTNCFAGLVRLPDPARSVELARSGLITTRVQANGTISGQISVGEHRRSFAGKLVPNEAFDQRSIEVRLSALPGSQSMTVRLTQWPGYIPYLEGVLILANGADTAVEIPLALDPILAADARERITLRGRYNLLVPVSSAYLDYYGANLPLGTGFISVDLAKADFAAAVGTLPNGAGITAGVPVVQAQDGLPAFLLGTETSDGDAVMARFAWSDLGFAVEPQIWAELLWTHAARPGSRLYPQLVPDLACYATGARYFPPAPGNRLLPELSGTRDAAVVLVGGGSLDLAPETAFAQSLRLTPRHQAVFPAGANNPLKMRLDFHVPTGLFSGVFTADDPAPGGVGRIRRQSQFRGLIVPSLNEGGGLFLLPELPDPQVPTSQGRTLIHAGWVQLTIPRHEWEWDGSGGVSGSFGNVGIDFGTIGITGPDSPVPVGGD